MKTVFTLLTVCGLLARSAFAGTQTENYGIPLLPAPGKVVIDGRFDDWDLTGGIFACNNVEEQRDRHSAWLHAMYDQDNLYVLARVKTQKPAESRQLRLLMLTGAGTPSQLQPNFSCSRDKDGEPSISLSFEPPLKNARDPGQLGAEQAYLDDPDGTGYMQEIRIPLKLITADGVSLGAGNEIRVLFILAFGWSLDAWDCFMPGVLLERTYWGTRKLDQFGPATFERSGKLKPRLLHLADGRKLPVSLKEGRACRRLVGPQRGAEGLHSRQAHNARGRLRVDDPPQRRRCRGAESPQCRADGQGRAHGDVGRPGHADLAHARRGAARRRLHLAGHLAQRHRPPPARLGGQQRQRTLAQRPHLELGRRPRRALDLRGTRRFRLPWLGSRRGGPRPPCLRPRGKRPLETQIRRIRRRRTAGS